MLIRIYDKAAEQNLEDQHWIRVELQMRDVVAFGFAQAVQNQTLGIAFLGVLRNYLRYVSPVADTNMSRWPETDYWQYLCQDVLRIRVWSCPGTNYTFANLRHYVIEQAGNAIDTYLHIFGKDALIAELGKRSIRLSPKYQKLKKQYEDVVLGVVHDIICNGPDRQ